MNLRSDAVACLLNHSEFKLTTKWINRLCTTLQPVVVATTTSSSLTLQCNNWQWLSLRKCPLCKRLHATWQIFWQFCSYESSWWHLVIVIALVGVGEGSHRHGDKSASFFCVSGVACQGQNRSVPVPSHSPHKRGRNGACSNCSPGRKPTLMVWM